MMLWQEDTPEQPLIAPDVVDLVFDMNCQRLPVDHAYALSQTIQHALPWLTESTHAGLHLIHGADSSHGWYRPDELLYLSRRTKLVLRLLHTQVTAAQALTGMTLDIDGYPLKVGQAVVRPLTPMPVLFARHILADPDEDETQFINTMAAQLQQLSIHCRKALCGKTYRFQLPEKTLFTRSLMIAELSPQESLTLQQYGLGEGRYIGCGLFVPHKDIKPVTPTK